MKRVLTAMMLCASLAVPAAAQTSFPQNPITLVVGWNPGGITDAFARTLVPHLEEELGVSIVVDNRGGAAGAIAAAHVADSAADGYTLLFAVASHAIVPVTTADLSYDVVNDFQPISLIHTAPNVIAVRSSLPVRTIEEFIELVRENPGEFTYASTGFAATTHITMASFAMTQDLDLIHVPYQGSGESLQAVLRGETEIISTTIPQAQEHFQSGDLVPLASAGMERDPALPEVPTFVEIGSPDVRGDTWFGLIGPAGMPQDVVDRLYNAVQGALQNEAYVTALQTRAQQIIGSTPEEFQRQIETDVEVHLRLRDAGLLDQE